MILLVDQIKKEIINFISDTCNKVNRISIEKKFAKDFNVKRRYIHDIVTRLINENELMYTYQYGSSYIERSFHKAFKVSDRIVIKPPRCTYVPHNTEVAMTISYGAAFGTGLHPTTRLCLKLIDTCLSERPEFISRMNGNGVDIGTGSGILAIAAALLGVPHMLGIDIDPCARKEAWENVEANHLEGVVFVSDTSLSQLNANFNFIMANLRLPTLVNIYPIIKRCALHPAALIFSGIRKSEIDVLVDVYSKDCFYVKYIDTEKEWASILFYDCFDL